VNKYNNTPSSVYELIEKTRSTYPHNLSALSALPFFHVFSACHFFAAIPVLIACVLPSLPALSFLPDLPVLLVIPALLTLQLNPL
jgi:hypothetical protein